MTDDGRHATGSEPDTTNQRMELMAVLRALEKLDGEVAIHSDSTYVVNCFNDRWYEGWLAKGWVNSQRKPVANRDLWEPLIGLYLPRKHEVTFTWVKGHSGNRLNDLADSLAVAEVERLKERLPTSAGPARLVEPPAGADPGAAAAPRPEGPEPPWPVERAVLVAGARDLDESQRSELTEALGQLDQMNDIVVSGLRLGAELEGAELGLELGLPLAVVLPFADPVAVWSERDRRRFDAALGAAHWVVTLDGDRARPGQAVARRDEWLRSAAIGAVIVGDDEQAAEAEQAGLGVITL